MLPASQPTTTNETASFDFAALQRTLETLTTGVGTLATQFQALQTDVSSRLDGVQNSISEVEVRLAATESQCREFSKLSQRVDELHARLPSTGSASSNIPPPVPNFAQVVADSQATPLPDDSMSDELPPARRQRLRSPRPAPRQRQREPRRLAQQRLADRDTPPENSVHFATDVGKFTKDLKTFLAHLFAQAFDTPLDIDHLTLKHSTPSRHSDIIFPSIGHANHFIAWVDAHPDVHDDHNNPIHIWANHTASPKQLAVGKILKDGFSFITSKVPKDVIVATNRRNGTLAVRHRGVAYVLFRVSLDLDGNRPPRIINGDTLPQGFPGLQREDIIAAQRMALDYIEAMRL